MEKKPDNTEDIYKNCQTGEYKTTKYYIKGVESKNLKDADIHTGVCAYFCGSDKGSYYRVSLKDEIRNIRKEKLEKLYNEKQKR